MFCFLNIPLVLVNRVGRLSLPKNILVRLSDRPDRTIAVYHERKATKLQ